MHIDMEILTHEKSGEVIAVLSEWFEFGQARSVLRVPTADAATSCKTTQR